MSFLSSLGKALKSKTVWAGIGTTALGAGEILQHYAPTILAFVPPASGLSAGIIVATGVVTIVGRIKAKQPLGPVIDDTIARSLEAVHVIGAQTNTVEGGTRTSIAAPQTTVGKVQQLAEVTALVKAPDVPKF